MHLPTVQLSFFDIMNMITKPKVKQAECPVCGMIYNIDMKSIKKCGINCYGCKKTIRLDPETVTFSVKEEC